MTFFFGFLHPHQNGLIKNKLMLVGFSGKSLQQAEQKEEQKRCNRDTDSLLLSNKLQCKLTMPLRERGDKKEREKNSNHQHK